MVGLQFLPVAFPGGDARLTTVGGEQRVRFTRCSMRPTGTPSRSLAKKVNEISVPAVPPSISQGMGVQLSLATDTMRSRRLRRWWLAIEKWTIILRQTATKTLV